MFYVLVWSRRSLDGILNGFKRFQAFVEVRGKDVDEDVEAKVEVEIEAV